MKTIDEIKKEVAKECAEEHFDLLFDSEIEVGDYETARKLYYDVIDRYIGQYITADVEESIRKKYVENEYAEKVRWSKHGDYIAVDIVDKKGNVVDTPFYITPHSPVEVHFPTPSAERPEDPSEYADWHQRYEFTMKEGQLYCRWLNGPAGAAATPSKVPKQDLPEWKFRNATKIF